MARKDFMGWPFDDPQTTPDAGDDDAYDDSNAYYADRLNVAWEILRHVAPAELPARLQGELGPVIDDVLTAARRLRG